MKIGTSLALIAVGLILAYAVDADIPVLDIRTLGSILFFVGLLGLAITVWLEVAASRRTHRPRPAPREPRARRPEPRQAPFDPLAGARDRPQPRDPAADRTRVLPEHSDDWTRRQ